MFCQSHRALLCLITLCSYASTAFGRDVEVRFSPNGGVAQAIHETLDQTTSTLAIAMYSFSDRSLQSKIEELARRGIKIRLLLDDARAKAALADRLEAAGVDVRYVMPVMHHKFVLADTQFQENQATGTVVTGSANWSTRSDTDYDEDLLIVRDEPGMLRAFQAEFDYLWAHARDYTGPAVVESPTPITANSDPNWVFTSANFELYHARELWHFRPMVAPEAGVAGTKIINAIDSAHQSIKIATTHFRRRDVANALRRAMVDRGVRVTLITDQQEYRAGSIPAEDPQGLHLEEALVRDGADVRYKTYMYRWHAGKALQMHSKYLIVDDQLVLTGSFNWSNNSETGSFENLHVWTDDSVVSSYRNNFQKISRYGDDGNGSSDRFHQLLDEIRAQDGRAPCLFQPITLTGQELDRLRRAYRSGACTP